MRRSELRVGEAYRASYFGDEGIETIVILDLSKWRRVRDGFESTEGLHASDWDAGVLAAVLFSWDLYTGEAQWRPIALHPRQIERLAPRCHNCGRVDRDLWGPDETAVCMTDPECMATYPGRRYSRDAWASR